MVHLDSSRWVSGESEIRVFVGIPIGETFLKEVLRWKAFRDSGVGIRWVSEKYLHVTLLRPWYVKRSDLFGFCRGIRQVESHPFSVEFEMVTCGPRVRCPRLIWALGKASFEFKTLCTSVAQLFKQELPCQPLEPHMTLGRFSKSVQFENWRSLRERVNWVLPVTCVVLYESLLKSSGAEYIEIVRYPVVLPK